MIGAIILKESPVEKGSVTTAWSSLYIRAEEGASCLSLGLTLDFGFLVNLDVTFQRFFYKPLEDQVPSSPGNPSVCLCAPLGLQLRGLGVVRESCLFVNC